METQTMQVQVSETAWAIVSFLPPDFIDRDNSNRPMWNTSHGPKTREGLALLIDQLIQRKDLTRMIDITIDVDVPKATSYLEANNVD